MEIRGKAAELQQRLRTEHQQGASWSQLLQIAQDGDLALPGTGGLRESFRALDEGDQALLLQWLAGQSKPGKLEAAVQTIQSKAEGFLLSPAAVEAQLATLVERDGMRYRFYKLDDDTGRRPFSIELPVYQRGSKELVDSLKHGGGIWLQKEVFRAGPYHGAVTLTLHNAEEWNTFIHVEQGKPRTPAEQVGVALRKLEESRTDREKQTTFVLVGPKHGRSNETLSAAEVALRLSSKDEAARAGLEVHVYVPNGQTSFSASDKMIWEDSRYGHDQAYLKELFDEGNPHVQLDVHTDQVATLSLANGDLSTLLGQVEALHAKYPD